MRTALQDRRAEHDRPQTARHKLSIGLIFSILILSVAGNGIATGTEDPFLPGSQPDLVVVQRQGDQLFVTVYDESAITRLRRVVDGTSELTNMVRVVTRQTSQDGWGTVLSEGHLPTTSQDDGAYLESCYIVLNENGDKWVGGIRIAPTQSLKTLYVCAQGWYEDAMILGIAFDDIGTGDTADFEPSPGSGSTIVVTNTLDSGTGTLRWALETAQSGDTITFDPEVFPPEDPATILVRSALPPLTCGGLTIDASMAGVILAGRDIHREWGPGLVIRSNGNEICGLRIEGFPMPGVLFQEGASENMIGGDRIKGAGPSGQGNVLVGNMCGIAFWDEGGSRNAILGNWIGAVPGSDELVGNVEAGIYISGSSTGNTIGPNNVIAGNGEGGVVIDTVDAVGTTITRNSIYGNAWSGILWGRGAPLFAPSITLIDIQGGVVQGFCGPGEWIEIFSDAGNEGHVYEGSVYATSGGFFECEVGHPLTGPNVTCTARDNWQNTSTFSDPKSASLSRPHMQYGNDNDCASLPRGGSTMQSRIGVLWPFMDDETAESAQLQAAHVQRVGFDWVHTFIDCAGWEEVGELEGLSAFRITEGQRLWLNELKKYGIRTVLGLVYWDELVQAGVDAEGADYSRFRTKESVQRYLDYVRFLMQEVAATVDAYSILNEPDVGGSPLYAGQYVASENYLQLLTLAVPVIREEDPDCKIVGANVSNIACEAPLEYLLDIVDSDDISLLDALHWHPMYGASPEYEVFREYYYAYPDLVRQVKRLATAHGFDGEFIGSEINWRIEEPEAETYLPAGMYQRYVAGNPWIYSGETSAKYYARGIVLHLGIDVAVGVSGIDMASQRSVDVMSRLCTAMAGHESIDMPVEIDIETDGPVAYCTFRYPNGDRMLAVWTDGIAQDEDPGISSTITFPGLAARSVTGIDVLHGFGQELIFETDGENTIIRDLLIKDYPILIRLSDIAFGPDYEETVGDGFRRLGDVNASPSSSGSSSDRDGDGVPDDEDFCPDWPGSPDANGC